MKEILLIDGFGSKNTEYAIYVDGIFLGKDCSRYNLPDEHSLLFKLIKKIAKENKIKIKFTDADISYALTSYQSSFPKTLISYQNKINSFYNKHKTFDSIKKYVYISAPYRPQDYEEEPVSKVYHLAGGQTKNFKSWYNSFLNKNKTFKELNKDFIEDVRIILEEFPDKSQSIWEDLNECWCDYLTLVFQSIKKTKLITKCRKHNI